MTINNFHNSIQSLTALHQKNALTKKSVKKEIHFLEEIIRSVGPLKNADKVLYCLEKMEYFAQELGNEKLKMRVYEATRSCLEKIDSAAPAKTSRLVFINDTPDEEDQTQSNEILTILSLGKNFPIIVPKSILLGKESSEVSQKLRKRVLDTFNNYTIYKQVNGNYLVFLPKQGETIDDLGLKRDNLQKIDVYDEIFKGTAESAELEQFFALFDENVPARKNITLTGHADSNHVAGFSRSQYAKLLTHFQNTGTEHLNVLSCQGGSTLKFHELEDETLPNFSIAVYSRGGFETGGVDYANVLFNAFSDYESFKAHHSPAVTQYHKNSKIQFSEYRNLPFIRLPSKVKEFQSFQPWGKGIRTFVLTQDRLQAHRLNPNHLLRRTHSQMTPMIKVENEAIFEIYPLKVDVPVSITGKCPFLHSLVPGHCHHLLEEVTIDFPIENLLLSAQKSDDNKAFIINKLRSGDSNYTNVMLFYSKDTCILFYRKSEKYYINEGSTSEEVTREKYVALYNSLILKSYPRRQNVLLTTGIKHVDINIVKEASMVL